MIFDRYPCSVSETVTIHLLTVMIRRAILEFWHTTTYGVAGLVFMDTCQHLIACLDDLSDIQIDDFLTSLTTADTSVKTIQWFVQFSGHILPSTFGKILFLCTRYFTDCQLLHLYITPLSYILLQHRRESFSQSISY